MRLELNCDQKVFVADSLRYGLNILGRIYGMQFAFQTPKINLMMHNDYWYYLLSTEEGHLFFPPLLNEWGDYFCGLPVVRNHIFENEVSVIMGDKELLRFTNIKIPEGRKQ